MRLLRIISSLFSREESSLQEMNAKGRDGIRIPFRTYSSRTPTQDALNPEMGIKVCTCGVRFSPRVDTTVTGDNPDLCLACNREEWSRLFTKRVPVTTADILPLRRGVK